MSRSSVLGQVVSFGRAIDRMARSGQPVLAEALESRQLLAAAIVGTVFEDLNKNGMKDGGEAGIAGVEITLTGKHRAGGAVKFETTTDKKGRFRFDKLAPGRYTATEHQPAGYKDGKDRCGTARSVIGNDVVANIKVGKKGKCRVTFGERVKPSKPVPPPPPPGSLSGYVYDDANDNGAKDEGESGIFNGRVELSGTTADGQAVQRVAITDAEGHYQFMGLKAGTYTVRAVQPDGFVDGIDAAGSLGGVVADDEIAEIVLGAGQDGTDYNFGELRPGSISGKVFLDVDGDGIMGAEESGVPDVLITLTGTDDIGESLTVSTRTGEDGSYEFTQLRPGTYQIVETQPFGLDEGQSIVGSAGGIADVNTFSDVLVGAGVDAIGYDFTEIFHDDGEAPPTDGGSDGGSDDDCDHDWDEWRGKWRRLLEHLGCHEARAVSL